jgi:hypothetical protein
MSHNPNDLFDPERFGLITGSVCSPLFPKKSAEVGQRNLAKKLANQMFFRFYDNVSTWQTEHGHNCESSAFEYYKSRFDSTAEYTPQFKRLENWGGQADCICENNGVDFKCPTTLEGWLDYLHEGISDQQFHQSQMYMFLYGKKVWHICAYLMETERMTNNGEVYPIEWTERMIIVKVEQDPTWVEKLIEITPKIVEMRNFYYNKLKEQFTQPIN